jgi:hypothetical protein
MGGPGTRKTAYLVLLALQIAAAALLTRIELPEFRQLLNNLGEQLRTPIKNDLLSLAAVAVMQAAYWVRLLCVPSITFMRPRIFVSHLFHFLSRISFIFGSSVFSVVFFRHVPQLGFETNVPLLMFRGVLLGSSLFALFCLSLDLDRWGSALEAGVNRNDGLDRPPSDS